VRLNPEISVSGRKEKKEKGKGKFILSRRREKREARARLQRRKKKVIVAQMPNPWPSEPRRNLVKKGRIAGKIAERYQSSQRGGG